MSTTFEATNTAVFERGERQEPMARSYTRRLNRLTHSLDYPTPAKGEFVEAGLSMRLPNRRGRMEVGVPQDGVV